MTQQSQTNTKRPVAMFALALLVGVLVSNISAVAASPFHLIWLPPSIVLVGLLTRGPTVLLPSFVGMAAAMWLMDASIWYTISASIAVVLAPFLTERAIQHLRRERRATSHLVQSAQLFVPIALIQAPIGAAMLLGAWLMEPTSALSGTAVFCMQWLIECATGIIFVRGIMTWMPNDGGGFCPVAGMSRGKRSVDPKLLRGAGLIGVLAAGATIALWLDLNTATRLFNILIFVVAAGTTLVSNRRTSCTLLMLASLIIATTHLHSAKTVVAGNWLEAFVELQLLLLIGGALLHFLNALVEERLTQQRRLRRKAFANEVTGMPNLRALNAFLSSARVTQRMKTEGIVLAEVSTTGLTRWADLAGRVNIMRVEREIGMRLRNSFAAQLRYLVHVGTGRFILVLDKSQGEEAMRGAVRTCFEEHRFSIGANQVRLHYSIGIVDVLPGKSDLETVLASLSIAQQQAVKSSDHFFRMTLDDREIRAYREDLAWMEKVREMLSANRIRLFAQPIAPASICATSPLYFEVLARMVGDNDEILTPDKFLPAISLLGQQVEFDRCVIIQTLNHLATDRELIAEKNQCAINVTGPSICDPTFPHFLISALSDRNIRADSIVIEVTESDAITDLEAAFSNVTTISNAGVQIAVDDFGTGRATFEYIRRFKPDILKIDGAFVRGSESDPLDKEIVHSIVRLAKTIGAKTVAEFVENEKIADQMRGMGLDNLQGWAIAKPMPIETVKAFCDEKRAEMAKAESNCIETPSGKGMQPVLGSI